MSFRLMDAQKANYPIAVMARVLGVSTSGYYDYKAKGGKLSPRASENQQLTQTIARIHADSRGTYGDLSEWQEVIGLAINLAGNCHQAYLKANPKVRRRFNEAVLQKVYVKDGKVTRAEFNDPFKALFLRPSSNKRLTVELRGFEPLASAMPWRRSTK